MYKLDRLKSEANKSAMFRDHVLGTWSTSEKSAINFCVICSEYVQVIAKPLPNDINIGGPVVAMNCDKRNLSAPSAYKDRALTT